MSDDDLPLLANVDQVLVRHYFLELECDFDAQRFTCCATLLLDPLVPEGDDGITLVLDCHQIQVTQVVGLDTAPEQFSPLSRRSALLPDARPLEFRVEPWALRVLGCPKVVCISYSTLPSCPSLLWSPDQQGRPAVFTHGSPLNNRSLFPCQDCPVAMATWEAVVTATSEATVLMSGDSEPAVTRREGLAEHYFHSKKPLPMSTLCLAVGFWEEITSLHTIGPKCRLFACPNLLDQHTKDEFCAYVPACMSAAVAMLGPYPFPRIDFLVVPPAFASLGMASPSVVFLSQSVFPMLCRGVSHEISHAWFGLSIGASDWTEEWLSEGFATWMEDWLHTRTTEMSNAVEFMEVKAALRRRTLLQEVENTSQELQVLRVETDVGASVVKNGRHPLKAFTQVHYIKGYFLLRYLCDITGTEEFVNLLKKYVLKFEGRLVTSRDFLEFLFESSPVLKSSLSVEDIFEKWLLNSGVPYEILNFKPSSNNKLFSQVLEEVNKWKKIKSPFRRKKAKRKKLDMNIFCPLIPEQTILVLEYLLDGGKLSSFTLNTLNKTLDLKNTNPEVEHRWFELVVKHRMRSEYAALGNFLMQHLVSDREHLFHNQGLGVYLYGEAAHSGDPELRCLAADCFARLEPRLEPNQRAAIQGMLSDTQP